MPRVLLFLLLLVVGGAAQAHVANLSSSTLEVAGHEVRARLALNPADVAAAVGQGGAGATLAYVDRHVAVLDSAGRACERTQGQVTAGQQLAGPHVEAALVWLCPGTPMTYRATLFQELDPAARHVVLRAGPDGERQAVLDARRADVPLAEPMTAAEAAWAYLLSGIEHILIGYDHVAFLLAVILWARSVRSLLAIVTGFTLAHSVTLSLAALDVVSVPGAVIEPLVAASIIFVAAENYIIPNAAHRWWVATLFGLVHGFAFAGALGEVGLPQGAKLVALVCFNLGVEVGQIAIVLIAVPLIVALERRLSAVAARRLIHATSGVLLVLGVYWMAERIPWA